MIERYEDPVLARVWSTQGYRNRLIEASIISLEVAGVEPVRAKFLLTGHGGLSIDRWRALEETYNHDIAAWVELVRQVLPEDLKQIWHRERTSSDLSDTAMGLGILQSFERLEHLHRELMERLCTLAHYTRELPVIGRTHGQYAEWTSVGQRFAVIAYGLRSTWNGVAYTRPSYGKMSGPVGNWNRNQQHLPLSRHGLAPVPSTQIVPRVHLASYMAAISAYSVNLTDLATLVRLGSRSASKFTGGRDAPDWCREGREGTALGSSSMPQKFNPIKSEKVTGLARLLRSNCAALIESSAGLWEERDISHSSVERVALVDSLHLLAHCMTEMTDVVANLEPADLGQLSKDLLHPTGVSAIEVLLADDDQKSFTSAYNKVKVLSPRGALNTIPSGVTDAMNWNRERYFTQTGPEWTVVEDWRNLDDEEEESSE